MEPDTENYRSIRRFSAFLLIYALFIILWGAFVRISGSGDGCGDHWPLCHGDLIPFGGMIQTWIEYFHRIKSALFGFLVLGLFIWSLQVFPKGHRSRGMAGAVLLFTIAEALIGAALVKFGWVDQDTSSIRVWMHSAHFCNTLALIAALVLFYVSTYFRDPQWVSPRSDLSRWMLVGVFGFLAIGVTGSWAALSGHLFPAESLAEGMALDFSEESPWYVQWRVAHPLVAVAHAILLIWLSSQASAYLSNPRRWIARWVQALVIGQIAFGFLTLLSLSPLWMKLAHLLWADLLWIGFTAMGAWIYWRDPIDQRQILRIQQESLIITRPVPTLQSQKL